MARSFCVLARACRNVVYLPLLVSVRPLASVIFNRFGFSGAILLSSGEWPASVCVSAFALACTCAAAVGRFTSRAAGHKRDGAQKGNTGGRGAKFSFLSKCKPQNRRFNDAGGR